MGEGGSAGGGGGGGPRQAGEQTKREGTGWAGRWEKKGEIYSLNSRK